jgi:hypothetical protein
MDVQMRDNRLRLWRLEIESRRAMQARIAAMSDEDLAQAIRETRPLLVEWFTERGSPADWPELSRDERELSVELHGRWLSDAQAFVDGGTA